ncbi:syndecan-1 [Odocoileus virginianus]|uniref:Syndecan n=2 Tax=Odocoileus virginianus TaxID=9874 RepID=A0ABM4HWM3_ODOVR
MRRAALWLWLCALALRLQPALPHSVAINMPPEDQDGSGDDNDNFSGSGAGALPDITSSQTPSTWKDLGPVTTTATAPEPTSPDAIAASTTVLPTREQPEGGGPVLLAEAGPGLTTQEKEATHPPSKTTLHPTTHGVSTARATTVPGPATSHPHRDVQPEHHETSAPTGRGHLEPHTPHVGDGGPSATEKAAEGDPSTQVPVVEGSGEQDFTFDVSGENAAGAAVEPGSRNGPPGDPEATGATGASQGLLDRKEVLGGVIAGGLVGLIFAVCLVGFMLYRMKKKDEGSYSLEEPKQANGGAYQKPTKQEEFYA